MTRTSCLLVSAVAVCFLGSALPLAAQQATPLSTKSGTAEPNSESLQDQVNALTGLVSDLQRRLDDAETIAAFQNSPWQSPEGASAPAAHSHQHRAGETACGSVCNYYHRFNWSEDAYLSVGGGLKTSYLAAEDMAANGSSYSNDLVLDTTRLYFNGRGHKYIGFELNTDIQNSYVRPFVTDSSAVQFRLLDAIAKLGDGGALNFWMGRMLPPSDRANLSGPFFINTYDFPFVSNERAIFNGRDDGGVLWGLIFNKRLKYQLGLYDGANSVVGGANPSDSPQFNARLVYNLLDAEDGYYNQSTYYGAKQIFAIGASVIHQNDGVFSATDGVSDYTSWTADMLFETKLDSGAVFTFNTAYYDYDTHVTTNDANANSRDGRAGLVEVAYMTANDLRVGNVVGRLRPLFRWQEYDRTFSQVSATQAAIQRGTDLELQYVINGSNARLSAGWGQRDLADGRRNLDVFLLGTQLQF